VFLESADGQKRAMRGKTAAWLDGSAPSAPFMRERLAGGCCIICCAGRDSIASSSWESASRIDAGARSCMRGTAGKRHGSDMTSQTACRFIARPVHEGDQARTGCCMRQCCSAGLCPAVIALRSS